MNKIKFAVWLVSVVLLTFIAAAFALGVFVSLAFCIAYIAEPSAWPTTILLAPFASFTASVLCVACLSWLSDVAKPPSWR